MVDVIVDDDVLEIAAYASRMMLPPPMQSSLPAGWLGLYREGVEPSGSLQKVSVRLILLFWTPRVCHDDESSRLDFQGQNDLCLCKFPHGGSYRACHACGGGRIQRNAGTGSDRGNAFGGDVISHAKLLTLVPLERGSPTYFDIEIEFKTHVEQNLSARSAILKSALEPQRATLSGA
jgi:hypothetical protein